MENQFPFGVDPEKNYTPNEVAEIRRCRPSTLESERLRGAGPKFIKSGRRVLYPGMYLIQWFESRTVNDTRQFGSYGDGEA